MAEDLQPEVHLNGLWDSVVASPCALYFVHSQFLLRRTMRWFSCCLDEIVKNLAKLLKILCCKSEYFCESFIS
jgi:hypothetical protein